METQNILYTALKHSHSGLRWILLILLILSIFKAFSKRKGGSVYPGKDSLFLATFIVTHVQFLIGIILYVFLSPYVSFEGGMGNIMGDSVIRFFTVEHIVGMFLAVILITMGHVRAKKQAELNKGWKTVGVYYLLGLLLILISIPWPFRGLGTGWF
ncbi:cytochrome B [Lewinellaceae bacterium SD302]|nr:cytochrome B [Lewinellaceae bacterium SD302]